MRENFLNPTASSLLIILTATLLLGTAANLLSPRRIPWVEDWARHVERGAADAGLQLADLAQAQAVVTAGTHVIFDARPPDAYNAGHLPGALSLPVDNLDALFPQFAPVLEPGTPLLVYCAGMECDESLRLGTFLLGQGYTNVTLFTAGYAAWQAAGKAGQP